MKLSVCGKFHLFADLYVSKLHIVINIFFKMTRKQKIFIIILIGLLVTAAFISSSYWLFSVYLPEQINTNEQARLFTEWYNNDTYVPPADKIITAEQLVAFLKVNEDLSVLLKKLRRQTEENKWRIAIDIIKMQPEWIAHKYVALKRSPLSPREYEWIEKEIVHFWIFRWKESSLTKLREFGWGMQMFADSSEQKPVNYNLLLEHEKKLNRIFDIIWPEETVLQSIAADTL
jgi:hypothetical protein